jgi:hypothetical protein
MYLVSNPVFSRRRGKGLIRSDVVEDFKFFKKPTGISISVPEILSVFFPGDFLSVREFPDVG